MVMDLKQSFSYVQDTVNGIVSLMESEHNDVFNIGNPNEITINEHFKNNRNYKLKLN